MMKRFLIIFTLAFVSLTTYATGQEGDFIYVEGEQWELLGKPVYADSVLSRELENALPEGLDLVTSNWAGYTAYWSIQQEKLCLDSICCDIYETYTKKYRRDCLSSDTLLRIFKKYVIGKRIVATWLSGDIRLAKGKMLYYIHSGYERNYEHERVISIKQGKVCGTKDYENYVVEGFSFDKQGLNNAEIRKMFPLHIEQYPELYDAKRISFRIKRARVDAMGHLVECEVKVIRPDDNPRLAAEFAEALKAYHPWRIMFINGEFRSYGIEGYTIHYLVNETQ